MDNVTFTALSTGLLVAVGSAQVAILIGQRQQQRLDWVEEYRKRWSDKENDWANLVYLGRSLDSYYQVANSKKIKKLNKLTLEYEAHSPTIWALNSVRNTCGTISDVCLKILQGQLKVQEIYPIFGTEFLRHSVALRSLLDRVDILSNYGRIGPDHIRTCHNNIRNEVQTWLICHDGIRRRCLIFIDLLWAEAARLEDLPPDDLKSAANAKINSGSNNRKRLIKEFLRLNSSTSIIRGLFLMHFLMHAEYRRRVLRIGINPKRLDELTQEWTRRYINKK
ncbi:hypothetical protein [Pectobacterium sp. 21LCBS03]|uniref:hypothetical protein n=1 Tax=Pectobacterium sp. 21LCBS03 TaxID=2935858 RepID=UPI00200EDCF6|nr:hypothetical protein [Pectobacterium sp. 21LCBS03]UPY96281.1 hypothetical protein MYB54_06120 [Pectobacterium sp. 21LCBS03]